MNNKSTNLFLLYIPLPVLKFLTENITGSKYYIQINTKNANFTNLFSKFETVMWFLNPFSYSYLLFHHCE